MLFTLTLIGWCVRVSVCVNVRSDAINFNWANSVYNDNNNKNNPNNKSEENANTRVYVSLASANLRKNQKQIAFCFHWARDGWLNGNGRSNGFDNSDETEKSPLAGMGMGLSLGIAIKGNESRGICFVG